MCACEVEREVVHRDLDAAGGDAVGDARGERRGRAPHRREDDDGLVALLPRRPARVLGKHRRDGVAAPDEAVRRRNDVDRPAGVEHLLNGLAHLRAERHEDVRVVDAELPERAVEAVLVGEALRGRHVLPERVVRHEDALLGAVREHRVGPVHHRHRQERHRPPAEVDDVSLLDAFDDEAVVVLSDVADAGDGRHHARLWNGRHDVGQGRCCGRARSD